MVSSLHMLTGRFIHKGMKVTRTRSEAAGRSTEYEPLLRYARK